MNIVNHLLIRNRGYFYLYLSLTLVCVSVVGIVISIFDSSSSIFEIIIQASKFTFIIFSIIIFYLMMNFAAVMLGKAGADQEGIVALRVAIKYKWNQLTWQEKIMYCPQITIPIITFIIINLLLLIPLNKPVIDYLWIMSVLTLPIYGTAVKAAVPYYREWGEEYKQTGSNQTTIVAKDISENTNDIPSNLEERVNEMHNKVGGIYWKIKMLIILFFMLFYIYNIL